MRLRHLLLAFSLLAVSVGQAWASASVDEMRRFHASLTDQLTRGRLAKVPESVKEELTKRSLEFRKQTDGLPPTEAPDEALQLKFVALQEAVKDAELEIMVCQRERRVGSNMPIRDCRSRRQRLEDNRSGREAMEGIKWRGATHGGDDN